ncbi:PIN domain-containing protein [Streptomyces sp. NPDC002574]|uniref:PIN domain-containing protein n=1 Tax=Streptomyces sp. NPDC002574 TaxID=3364652 RepID=UPI00367593C8
MSGEVVYLLDSEGLSQWVRGERRMGMRIKDANRVGIRVMTTSITLIEAYDPTRYLPSWHWALSRIHVEPVTEELAEEAIRLIKETGLHGHKYAIDAALAAVALRQPGPVTVFTSDEDDMRKLCANRVAVVKL